MHMVMELCLGLYLAMAYQVSLLLADLSGNYIELKFRRPKKSIDD